MIERLAKSILLDLKTEIEEKNRITLYRRKRKGSNENQKLKADILTPREREAWRLRESGKSIKEASFEMGVSVSTYGFYICVARKKLKKLLKINN